MAIQTQLDLLGIAWQMLQDLINNTLPGSWWQMSAARSRIYSAPTAPPI